MAHQSAYNHMTQVSIISHPVSPVERNNFQGNRVQKKAPQPQHHSNFYENQNSSLYTVMQGLTLMM